MSSLFQFYKKQNSSSTDSILQRRKTEALLCTSGKAQGRIWQPSRAVWLATMMTTGSRLKHATKQKKGKGNGSRSYRDPPTHRQAMWQVLTYKIGIPALYCIYTAFVTRPILQLKEF